VKTPAHFAELQTRLRRALGVVAALALALYLTQTHWLPWFTAPLARSQANLQFTTVTGPFVSIIQLSVMLALLLAVPYLLGEVWGFVSPGLYKTERRRSGLFLLLVPGLFYIGLLVAFLAVLPNALAFLLQAPMPGLAVTPTLESYVAFTGTLCLAFGLGFNLPVVLYLLIRAGLVDPARLKAARRYVAVGIFAAAGFITPPDPLSMLLLAVPLWLMFEATLLLAKSPK
jgi:sec-independent protein translocase protein TatC